jgi:TrmH family RNA methyltransferase
VVAEEDAWPDGLERPNHIVWLERGLFRDLDIFGTHFPIAVLTLPEMKKFAGEPPKGLELVLSLQDPSNLGAVLRSAHAFGVTKVILLKECAFPFHPKAIRSSSGSSLRVVLEEGPTLKEFSDSETIALDMQGEPLTQFSWSSNARLLIGEEGQGLPPQFTGKRISIPMTAELDSLNAAIAASIALFSYRSQIT